MDWDETGDDLDATQLRRTPREQGGYGKHHPGAAPQQPGAAPQQPTQPYTPQGQGPRSRRATCPDAGHPYAPRPYAPQTQRAPRPQAGPARAPRPDAPRQRGPKPARHGCLSLLLWLVMLPVLGLLALRLLPLGHASGALVPELVSFVPLALVPSLACLVLACLWRRRVLAIVCALALATNAWWHAGYFAPTARVSAHATAAVAASASTDDAYARIMTLNTLNGRASAKQIVQTVREQHVEVLCLQELTDGMVSDLEAAGIDELLPYHVVSTGASSISNGGRNGIWTAAPEDNVSRNLLPIETSSMPAASIQIGSRTVRVVSVHPNSPTRGAEDLWNEGLSIIGSLSGYDHSYLIMGDFNSTWDHARFRDLLGSTFVDASQQSGEGFHMTYPSNSSLPSLIEIDHIVYARDSGITVSSLETVEIAGSDHKALVATLEIS